VKPHHLPTTRLGHALASTIGQRGNCYRIGGDEFYVILPGQRATVEDLLETRIRPTNQPAEPHRA
jgi:GGDEF domain-containing protein